MLSVLLAFVQTTLLIKTVQLCSKLIFAERWGGGVKQSKQDRTREREKESERKKENKNWMRPDQAVLKGIMLCCQKYQIATAEIMKRLKQGMGKITITIFCKYKY